MRKDVEGGGFSEIVRGFLLRQVDDAERVLDEYPLRGVEAITTASNASVSEWIDHAEELQGVQTDPTVRQVFDFWPWMGAQAPGLLRFGRSAAIFLQLSNGVLGQLVAQGVIQPTDAARHFQTFTHVGQALPDLKRLASGSGPERQSGNESGA